MKFHRGVFPLYRKIVNVLAKVYRGQEIRGRDMLALAKA
jgi:hypothetical protein